jgi:hypothetical protein
MATKASSLVQSMRRMVGAKAANAFPQAENFDTRPSFIYNVLPAETASRVRERFLRFMTAKLSHS